MKARLLARCFLFAIVAVADRAGGETINWYSAGNKTNLTSVGSNMGASFAFQLGVFSGGFVPTASNLNQWAANWVSAGSAPYSSDSKSFDGLFTVTSNALPFTVGAKAYVWGRSIGATGDEWILFRHNSWTWPVPNAGNSFVLEWNAATANEIILGTIGTNATPFLMQSASVVSYTHWRNSTLAGYSLNGANDDADHDGASNALEFALGSSPTSSVTVPSFVQSFIAISGQSYLQISVQRPRNRLTTLTTEVSSNLTSWSGAVTEVTNSPILWVVRDNTPLGPGLPKRFMRIKAVIQP